MLTFGIRARLLILLLGVTLLPLLALNFFWTTSQRTRLLDTTKTQHITITQRAADKVDASLAEKIRVLIIHSQSSSMLQMDKTHASQDIAALLYQDKDIQHVSLVSSKGQEVIALDRTLTATPLRDLSGSDAYRVVNFLGGKEYVSPVTVDKQGLPHVTIAVPLLAFTQPQDLNAISTAESGIIRTPSDIKGMLLADISLANLWKTVLSDAKTSSQNTDSYAYVVDDKGTVIAHPDKALVRERRNVANTPVVAEFLKNINNANNDHLPHSTEGNSEKSVASLATYQTIPTANWGIVFEQPLGSVYANLNRISQVGLALTLAVLIVVCFLGFLVSRYFTMPILAIARTAEKIGGGDFNARVPAFRRSDEIGALGQQVNAMGQGLQQFIDRMETERNQLQIILNSTAEGVIAINKDKVITIANHATRQITYLPAQLLIGKPIDSVLKWSRDKEPFAVDYNQAGVNTYEKLEYTSSDGVTHYIDLVVAHLDVPEEAVQAIITIHDLTKSRELERMKVDFVSMAAHELRTPITAIRGYIELILYKFGDSLPAQVMEYINHSHRSSLELIGLINNLLNISRIERDTLSLSIDKVDWGAAIIDTVNTLKLNAKEKNITLEYTGPPDNHFIAADPIAIQEVINNLVSNAIKFTPAGGRVTIAMYPQDDNYITEVHDTGIGIPPNAVPHLFTKFYRVASAMSGGNNGTGLGLFISKSIVERHGGKIWVQSKEDSGSVFSFSLPIFDPSRPEHQHIQEAQDNTVRRQRGWITKNITR